MRKPKVTPIVAVADFETDPFKHGRVPAPFCVELYYDTDECLGFNVVFWGLDCASQLLDYLDSVQTPLVVYMHNGGKFDFHFILSRLQNPLKIINGRLVRAKYGVHEFRDSWAIIPMPLKAANAKTDIDYTRLESNVREKHRVEILAYLHDDCVYSHQLVLAFVTRFGTKLTIAGTASKELRKFHPQYRQKEDHDKKFRPFYYGGRVQCFESGVIHGNFKLYDVNSMYPHVMREFRHPLGGGYVDMPEGSRIDSKGWIVGLPGYMYFATVRGWSKGSMPMRENTGLSFSTQYGTFQTTSHELRAAIELGLFKLDTVEAAFVPRQTQSFVEFVDTFVAEKIASKKSKDKIGETFSKLILNSAYGRFGLNPFGFWDYFITEPHSSRPDDVSGKCTWEPYESSPEFDLYRRRVNVEDVGVREELGLNDPTGFEDVAIAASITSAARSVLMRSIASAYRPIYCDTDSLICERLTGVEFSDTKLGAWKHEASGNRIAIAGKKLYALFDGDECVKMASKGVRLSSGEIESVAKGESVLWESQAPNFSLKGPTTFVKRVAKRT